MRRHTITETPVGPMTLVADGPALAVAHFAATPERLAAIDAGPTASVGDAVLDQAAAELAEYFAGRRRRFDVPLDPRGAPFERRVWHVLTGIPYGDTTTYGAVAEALGDRRQAQAVGQAVGRNPLGVFIPCHRVIGADGSLTGFAAGLDRKRYLLALEEPDAESAGRLF